jgi:regulator of sirC expression with transglutaminase-like and TPR domain
VTAAFADLAARDDATLDELALALAAEFREIDAAAALAELDRLADDIDPTLIGGDAEAQARGLREALGDRAGFNGDHDDYDDPANSMLDLVLVRRQGLPILLSIVYVEVARRAGLTGVHGVGLPGHYVVGHFGATPPILLDAFDGGVPTTRGAVPPSAVRPWGTRETALRVLNNLVSHFSRRADVLNAIRSAELRLALPVAGPARERLEAELRALRATLN